MRAERTRSVLAACVTCVVAALLLASSEPAVGYPLAAPVSYAAGTNAHGVTVADLNGDSNPDLAVANAGSNNVSVLLGQGNGTFAAQTTYAVGAAPKQVAVADVTGDGRLDLVSANQDSNNVSILAGNGAGGFAPSATPAACSRPHEVAVGDFNADGRRDLAVACWNGSIISVLLNSASGFGAPQNYGAGGAPHSLVATDLSGDGLLDLAVANHNGASVSVLLGLANGTFATRVDYAVGSGPHSIRHGDFNGDGRRDLATANDAADTVSVLLGTGTGTFSGASSFATGSVPKGIFVGDVDGDGRDDAVTSNTAGNYPTGANNPGGDKISVLLGNGSGGLAAPVEYTAGDTPFAVSGGDVNRDGRLDLVTANYFGNNVSVLLNLPSTLPPGFSDRVIFSGLTFPTAVRFSGDGRVFVAEKSGVIKVFDNLADTSPTIFADLSTKVHNFWDRGMLGLELHPGFPATPYVYVLYTHDAAIGGQAPRWGTAGVRSDPCPTPPGATGDGCVVSGRLSRLQASGNVMTGSEQVLVEDWCQQYPSHSVGGLEFGSDGALYATGGDGASFLFTDYGQDGSPVNPCGDPPGGSGATLTPPSAEGGALRSQDMRTMGDPVGLNGTIIRVNPATGEGMPDNPNAGSPNANVRRIVGYGLRNPFRLAVRPGSGEVWIGDVGWFAHEELNTLPSTGVPNFGWPCYEGPDRQASFDNLDLTLCETLYGESGAVRHAQFRYSLSVPVTSGDTCENGSSSLSGLAFYTTGPYPDKYDGALFFADYSRKCAWVLLGGNPATPEAFGQRANPVDLQVGPGGDVFYVDFDGGTIRRIEFGSTAPPPPGPTGNPYVSDLTWTSMGNGWGPVERDRSNGEQGAGDGGPLTLNGVTYAKGLGTHAASDVRYALAGSCSAMTAIVGLDDEVGSNGSVVFQVFADGTKLYDSGTMSGTTASKAVSVDLTGRNELRLVVTDAGNGVGYDHGDWADAKLTCSGGGADTTPPTVTAVTPSSGSTGVPTSVRPTATFSEAMDATTINTTTFTLRRNGTSTDLAATIAWDSASRTATLTPQTALTTNATYTATIKAGSSGVKDTAGNPLSTDHTFTFTTTTGGGNAPPVATIAAPTTATQWAVGDTISFSGSATDPEDGTLAPSGLSWTLVLHHCPASCHQHTVQTFDGVASGSFSAPDHDYPSHLELRLTATDAGGLTDTESVQLDPQTVEITIESSPTGLQVALGASTAATPFTRSVIVGSTNSLTTSSPQTLAGKQYAFDSWFHGGAQSQTFTAPSENITYTAVFEEAGTRVAYLSDLTWTSATNGWGPVEKDASNGENGAGDGGPLTLNGTRFAKGLGVHAASDVRFSVGSCTRFVARVGLDDEVEARGSATFEVWVDSTRVYQSGPMTPSSATGAIDVSVTGGAVLRLVVTDAGDGVDSDHADWAGAHLICPDT